MNDNGITTLKQVRRFLEGTEVIDFAIKDNKELYTDSENVSSLTVSGVAQARQMIDYQLSGEGQWLFAPANHNAG